MPSLLIWVLRPQNEILHIPTCGNNFHQKNTSSSILYQGLVTCCPEMHAPLPPAPGQGSMDRMREFEKSRHFHQPLNRHSAFASVLNTGRKPQQQQQLPLTEITGLCHFILAAGLRVCYDLCSSLCQQSIQTYNTVMRPTAGSYYLVHEQRIYYSHLIS